jgi:hypothetical protein
MLRYRLKNLERILVGVNDRDQRAGEHGINTVVSPFPGKDPLRFAFMVYRGEGGVIKRMFSYNGKIRPAAMKECIRTGERLRKDRSVRINWMFYDKRQVVYKGGATMVFSRNFAFSWYFGFAPYPDIAGIYTHERCTRIMLGEEQSPVLKSLAELRTFRMLGRTMYYVPRPDILPGTDLLNMMMDHVRGGVVLPTLKHHYRPQGRPAGYAPPQVPDAPPILENRRRLQRAPVRPA